MIDIKNDIDKFIVGKSYKTHMPSLGEFRRIVIVVVINDGFSWCDEIVYRYWVKHKRRWFYEIENAYLLTGRIRRAQEVASKCIQS